MNDNKFTLDEVLSLNFDLMLETIKCCQIIKDPFPGESDISIYRAYKKGYDKAYSEVKEGLKQKIEQELTHILNMREFYSVLQKKE